MNFSTEMEQISVQPDRFRSRRFVLGLGFYVYKTNFNQNSTLALWLGLVSDLFSSRRGLGLSSNSVILGPWS